MKLILLATFIVGSAVAQIITEGECPAVNVVSDFDVNKYLGKWYEAERYLTIYDATEKCVTATYSLGKNGTITVVNKHISTETGKESSTQGYATQNLTEKAKLKLVLSTQSVVGTTNESNYWVVDTDYTSYSAVWSCTDISGFLSATFAWIFTRERNPGKTVLEKAYQAFDKSNVNRSILLTTNQTGCPADS